MEIKDTINHFANNVKTKANDVAKKIFSEEEYLQQLRKACDDMNISVKNAKKTIEANKDMIDIPQEITKEIDMSFITEYEDNVKQGEIIQAFAEQIYTSLKEANKIENLNQTIFPDGKITEDLKKSGVNFLKFNNASKQIQDYYNITQKDLETGKQMLKDAEERCRIIKSTKEKVEAATITIENTHSVLKGTMEYIKKATNAVKQAKAVKKQKHLSELMEVKEAKNAAKNIVHLAKQNKETLNKILHEMEPEVKAANRQLERAQKKYEKVSQKLKDCMMTPEALQNEIKENLERAVQNAGRQEILRFNVETGKMEKTYRTVQTNQLICIPPTTGFFSFRQKAYESALNNYHKAVKNAMEVQEKYQGKIKEYACKQKQTQKEAKAYNKNTPMH